MSLSRCDECPPDKALIEGRFDTTLAWRRTDRHIDRQRQTDNLRERERDRQTDRDRQRQTEKQTYRQSAALPLVLVLVAGRDG